MSVEEFFKWLAADPQAKTMLDKVFATGKCSMFCRICVEQKVDYWYHMWLFGIRDRKLVAEDISSCINE